MKSNMVTDTEHCVICGSNYVEEHHVFHGTANRAKAEKYHLTIPLCNKHHTGSADCPHKNKVIDLAFKCWGQTVFEQKFGTREDFRREFGKSVL